MSSAPSYVRWLRPFVILASLAIILGLASWAQAVLVPVALAILLTFLLTPVLNTLEGYGLGRVWAVIVVVALAMTVTTGLGWLIGYQVASLVDTFPEYEENLNRKVLMLRESGKGGFVDRLESVVRTVSRHVYPEPPLLEVKPQPVKVVSEDQPLGLSRIWSVLGPAMEPISSVALAGILVIFMLLRREDLRDRLISVVGHGRLTVTTKALDEAGQRISRYLLMQLIVNGSFGASVALGLFALGVPYPALWGFLSGTLRYIPYLGPWIAAMLPIALGVLIFDGWTVPVSIVGLFLVLELVSNMIIEPWLYGKGIGVSEAATLVMVSFWTWLWGPIGLVLATPLTVVLVVLGRHVTFLRFFETLLGDQPALEAHVGYYQRLLAHDQDEASDIAEDYWEKHSLVETFEELLAPALANARRDLDADRLTENDQNHLLRATREIVEELATLDEQRTRPAAESEGAAPTAPLPSKALVLACPARDETDEAALSMLQAVLDPKRCEVELMSSAMLTSEVVAYAEKREPAVLCILVMPPGGLAQARLLCLRLKARLPHLKVVVGRWSPKGASDRIRAQLSEAGANEVCTTIAETKAHLMSLSQVSRS